MRSRKTVMRHFYGVVSIVSVMLLPACATLTNAPNVPIQLSFLGGETGTCTLINKRGEWRVGVPSRVELRRSDDSLSYDCQTDNGKKAFGYIESGVDSVKSVTSFIYIDLGVTDAVTDMHRTYPEKFVIQAK